ncbi:hypothetical protein ACFP2T_39560 [Plantactinospora solaniradicis]|uniref:Uncharacterized protein n=1 Tax=Plantactinospora solaniradicis TaxID=1723736 RepID=A0ABW1KM99_9ACTN
MIDDGADLVVRVIPADGDQEDGEREELAGLARRLRAELLDLDVELVEPLTEDTAPEGAKGLSSLAGVLGVRLGVAGLRVVVARVREWASRNGRTVEVTIDGDTVKVTGATAQQQEQLVNVWLARHAPGS